MVLGDPPLKETLKNYYWCTSTRCARASWQKNAFTKHPVCEKDSNCLLKLYIDYIIYLGWVKSLRPFMFNATHMFDQIAHFARVKVYHPRITSCWSPPLKWSRLRELTVVLLRGHGTHRFQWGTFWSTTMNNHGWIWLDPISIYSIHLVATIGISRHD